LRIRFDEFVFDGEARELARAGHRLDLSPKAFRLLEALLATRPRALTRAELTDRLWPDTAMGYTSLSSVATELRKALGDDLREPLFLRTVHGFGYAFCGEASEEPVPASRAVFPCALFWEGRQIGLAEGENIIGRAEGCAVRIDSGRVSRQHARILVQGRAARLEDLGSKNGTFLRGRKLNESAELADGDEISIGGARFFFRSAYGPGTTLTG
jgi:DNA-binding winged helix-turn-helix (wHTH) protein